MLVRNSFGDCSFCLLANLGNKERDQHDADHAHRPRTGPATRRPTDYSEKIQRPAIFVGDWRPVYGSTTRSKWPLATPTLLISSRYSEDRITELAASAEGCRNGRGPYCG